MRRLIRRILIFINILLAGVLLLSYLSVHVSPARYWMFAFLGLSYPYLLSLNILFCIFWLLFLKWEFVLSLAAILIGWNQLANLVQFHFRSGEEQVQAKNLSRQERIDQGLIKVLSFNVHAFNLYNWNKDPESLNNILDFIKKEDPDILCIQEFYAEKQGKVTLNDVHRALKKTPYKHIYYTIDGESNGKYGIATFSSLPVAGKGVISFDNTLNACIFTNILAGEDTLRIYNNHLQSIYLEQRNYLLLDSLSLRYNEEQINELKDISFRIRRAFVKRALQADKIADHMRNTPYPAIVCGDFNDTPSSYTYHKLRNGLADAFVEAGSGFGNTYEGSFPSFRIDYILHDKSMETVYFKRIKTRLSDHYPLISILKIKH